MKVTHVISGLRSGGAEHMLLQLCNEAKRDSEVSFSVASLSYINDLPREFSSLDVFPTDLNNPGHSQSRSFSTFLKTVRHLVKQPTGILHGHLFYSCIALSVVKILRPRNRVVFSLHNSHLPGLWRRFFLFATKPLRNADIIFPNQSPKWYLKRDAIAIPNGISLTEKTPARPAGRFQCLFAGRLVHQKNPFAVVHAANELKNQQNIFFVIAGDGPLRSSVIQQVNSFGLSDRFQFTGTVDHNKISEFMAGSHCLLLPSLYEGMPLVILEAAACELPVIATHAAAEAYGLNNENAWIADESAFADAIRSIIADQQLASVKAARLRTMLSQFTIANTYRLHKQLYLSLSQRI